MADVELSTLGGIIKTAYEAEANTNAFTDAEQTKVAQAILADGTVPMTGLTRHSIAATITASATSIQGGSPITTDIAVISTCVTSGDSVTLPAAVAGYQVTIFNDTATSADIFPASGDDLGQGVNTARALSGGSTRGFFCYDTTNWFEW